MRPWEKKKVGADFANRDIRPTQDRILVKLDKPKDFTGVIFIPPGVTEDKATIRAEVIAVGPGKPHRKTGEPVPLDARLQPGVRIVMGKYAGTEIFIHGEAHRLIPSTDVLAFENEDQAEVTQVTQETQEKP
jgi:co-chaperonin GroES (HSP10)